MRCVPTLRVSSSPQNNPRDGAAKRLTRAYLAPTTPTAPTLQVLRHSSEPAEGAVCEEKSQIWQEALVNLLDKSAILYICSHGEAPDSSWSTVVPRGSWRRPFLRSAGRNQSTRRLGVGWFFVRR